MIGWVRDLLVDNVIAPQGTDAVPAERRAYLDPESTPLDVEAQEIDLLGLSTTPLSYEIGGGLELRHKVDAGLEVQHGDPAEARRLRDGIVLDLILRLLDTRSAIMAASDPVSGQYVTRVDFTIDYSPLVVDTPNEYATVTFTVDTTLDR